MDTLGRIMLFQWLLGKWLKRQTGLVGAGSSMPTASSALRGPTTAPGVKPKFTPKQWAIPPALAGFQRREVFDLPVDQVAALRQRVAQLPRPPQDIEQLLSEAFLQGANAEQLAEAILKHPHLAARLLALVNSPFYGLARPVSDVPSAIVYLGLDTVRAVAVQCLLEDALRPTDPDLALLFDRWWRASSLASQWVLKLGKHVGVTDPGGLVTLAVLSFVGHMAALTLRDPKDTLRDSALDFLDRTRAEQADLGLCAGELGCLMMAEWNMPASIVEQVRSIDRILVMPPRDLSPEQGLRISLTYYCARAAERFASGQWGDLAQAVPGELEGAEFFHLQTHFMLQPRLAQLAVDVQQAPLQQALNDLIARTRS